MRIVRPAVMAYPLVVRMDVRGIRMAGLIAVIWVVLFLRISTWMTFLVVDGSRTSWWLCGGRSVRRYMLLRRMRFLWVALFRMRLCTTDLRSGEGD